MSFGLKGKIKIYFPKMFNNYSIISTYLILIDRKFNKEQFLLETFFPKIHIERDVHKKLIFKFIQHVKTPIKSSGVGEVAVVLICCLRHRSRTFSTLKLLRAHFCNIFPSYFDLICIDNLRNTLF